MADAFKKLIPIILLLILSFFAIEPLFHPGFFPMHDDTQVVRVDQMAKALRDGQFPVRWVADLGYGYGYPIYNFYAPLPYYFGGLFVILGFDALTATKIMFGLAILASAIFMYLFAGRIWGKAGAFLSAILYQYVPYHALDIYVRGAVGEFWAAAFMPLAFYGIYCAFATVNKKNQARLKDLNIAVIGFTGVILSHNISAMLIFLVAVLSLMLLILVKRKRTPVLLLLFITGLSLALSAFFIVPAIFEMKLTNVGKIISGEFNFSDHFVFWDQLWNSAWGFAGSAKGRMDGMSFKIGKLHLIFALSGLIFVLARKRSKWFLDQNFKFSLYFLLLFLFSVFMTLELSKFVYDLLSFLVYIQYPWRFLIFTVFSVSVLGGGAVIFFREKTRWFISFLLTIMVLFLNVKYFSPQKYLNVQLSTYLGKQNIIWQTSKISDEYLPKNFPVPENEEGAAKEKFIFDNPVYILKEMARTQIYKLEVLAEKTTFVKINTAYFPKWQLILDGRKVPFEIAGGVMEFVLPAGKHELTVVFEDTAIRKIANLISLLSLPLLFDKIRRKLLPFIYG